MGCKCLYLSHNSFWMVTDIVVGNTQKVDPECLFQDLLPVTVALLNAFNLVDAALHFHGKFCPAAVEVQPKRSDDLLTPKVQPATAVIPQSFPEIIFGQCRPMPCLPCQCQQCFPH